MSRPRRDKTPGRVRVGVLAALTLFTAVWGFLHQWVKDWKTAGVDALCPFGTLESAWALLTRGEFLTKVGTSSLVLLIGTLVTALLFRRAFCGQICPLGFLQELFGRLGRRLWKRPPALPAAVDRVLRYGKYLVFAGIVVLSWAFAELVVRPFDPWAAWMHLTSPELLTEMGVGLALLVLGLVGSLFEERAFCRYACPMGAFLGAVSQVGLSRVVRNTDTCIDCKACTRACPVALPVHASKQVTSAECLSCGLCVTACPVADTLDFRLGPQGPKVKPLWVTLGTVAILGTTMAVGAAAGQFSMLRSITTNRSAEGREASPTNTTAPATLDIRGRDSLREVAQATGLPLEVLLDALGVDEAHADQPIRDLKTDYPNLERQQVVDVVQELLSRQNQP